MERSPSTISTSSQRSTRSCCAALSKIATIGSTAGEHIIATIALPPDPNVVLVPSSAFVDGAKSMTIFVQDKDDPTRFQLRNVESAGRSAPARQRSIRSTPRNERAPLRPTEWQRGKKFWPVPRRRPKPNRKACRLRTRRWIRHPPRLPPEKQERPRRRRRQGCQMLCRLPVASAPLMERR